MHLAGILENYPTAAAAILHNPHTHAHTLTPPLVLWAAVHWRVHSIDRPFPFPITIMTMSHGALNPNAGSVGVRMEGACPLKPPRACRRGGADY